MKLKQMKNKSQAPSTSIGIMKFNETMSGIKVAPELVIGLSVGFVVLIIVLKLFI